MSYKANTSLQECQEPPSNLKQLTLHKTHLHVGNNDVPRNRSDELRHFCCSHTACFVSVEIHHSQDFVDGAAWMLFLHCDPLHASFPLFCRMFNSNSCFHCFTLAKQTSSFFECVSHSAHSNHTCLSENTLIGLIATGRLFRCNLTLSGSEPEPYVVLSSKSDQRHLRRHADSFTACELCSAKEETSLRSGTGIWTR